uniref:Tyrosine-protein phosphatase 10D-like n=1 Tax=Drosophila rhopaloa TaxID=1041015 RepID=A0A6P4F0Q3_DRORH
MICKDSKGGNIDVLEYESQQQHQQAIQGAHTMTTISAVNGYNTLQHRRKSQLITFSSSSCDIKNSLSHEHINGSNGSASGGAAGSGSGTGSNRASRANVRLSFAEEDVMILPQNHQQSNHQEDEVFTRRRSLLEVEIGVEVGEEGELVPHELDEDLEEEDEDDDDDDDEEVDEELYMHDEFETHIDAKSNNANDDSGGGSYEDSHALHSSLGGSNRNSLEKDDDDIEVDVISTDVSCYDQLLGSSCNTRNGDDDDIATLVGDGDYATTKLCKSSRLSGGGGVGGLVVGGLNGSGGGGGGCGGIGVNGGGVLGNGVGSEAGGGIIYANPFMDDEGIAESGM